MDSWYAEVAKASWSSPADIKAQYANASIISSDRVVFNIKGNDYRLVVAIHYHRQIVFILWIGTHQEYDWIDARKDYECALREIQRLWNAPNDSPGADRLDVLATLVSAYEDKHFPMDVPDPIEAIKFRMEQMGLKRSDLEPLIGSRSRVAEVLNRRRPLSLAMIRKLRQGLGIPAEVLIR